MVPEAKKAAFLVNSCMKENKLILVHDIVGPIWQEKIVDWPGILLAVLQTGKATLIYSLQSTRMECLQSVEKCSKQEVCKQICHGKAGGTRTFDFACEDLWKILYFQSRSTQTVHSSIFHIRSAQQLLQWLPFWSMLLPYWNYIIVCNLILCQFSPVRSTFRHCALVQNFLE